MIEEIIADKIEEIFEQKQLGHISSDHAREQLIKQLMYLTQAQREACAEAYLKNRMFSDCAHEILFAEVKP